MVWPGHGAVHHSQLTIHAGSIQLIQLSHAVRCAANAKHVCMMQRRKNFRLQIALKFFLDNVRRAQKTEWQAPSSNWIERKNRMSAQAQKFGDKKSARRRREEFFVKDERGWAGQHGQRPANEEEKNFESPMKDKAKENSARPQMPRGKQSSHSHSRMKEHRAGRNRSEDQAGGPEHSGGDAREGRNP